MVRIARKTQGDLGTYVAKIARDRETGQRVLDAYQLAHSHLRHSGLSTIFEVASEWEDNSFVALMTWIEGSPLGEYAGVMPILAEDLDEESGEKLALRWLWTACEALSVLHDNGLVHGDLSPRNLIVSGSNLVITDYDCVTKIGTAAASPGTVIYSSPSRREGLPVTPCDDIYSLAASFFHVLFDKEPFRPGRNRSNSRRLNWDDVPRDEYRAVASFLDQATSPKTSERFATTAEAIAALVATTQVRGPGTTTAATGRPKTTKVESLTPVYPKDQPTERRENEVPWLRSVLQSYPGSLWGNTETRGLDSEFAARTYVETDLEQALYRDLLERRASLVILCGNAGDGKTALLQHLAGKLGLGDHPVGSPHPGGGVGWRPDCSYESRWVGFLERTLGRSPPGRVSGPISAWPATTRRRSPARDQRWPPAGVDRVCPGAQGRNAADNGSPRVSPIRHCTFRASHSIHQP